MRNEHTIAVIIPVLNEEASIARVVGDIPSWVDDIIVVDNGSTDDTARIAAAAGARVVTEPCRGYGAACLRGMEALKAPDLVVFVDGDYSDHPEEMPLLVDPIIHGEVDFMVGSRARGVREPGSLTPQAAFGNWLATRLIRLFWGIQYTDLGPFRAIRYRTLLQLDMRDRDYGWTVEMQIKAALHAVPADEVPVSYRKRAGVSKVSGTIRGVVGAGYKILGTIAASALFARPQLKSGLLVFFTRFPAPGAAKTRLIPALGPEGASDLHRDMTEHALAMAPPLLEEVEIAVRYDGADEGAMRAWLGPEPRYAVQGQGDLGVRMARAFEEAFQQAYGTVVICGTDCPAMSSVQTMAAFQALAQYDCVVGPAADGGFYLIGLGMTSAPDELEALFEGVVWGGETVLAQTLANAEALGLSVHQLDTLSDVDVPEDLPQWTQAQQKNLLSVIIPAWNEAETIERLLDALDGQRDIEVIVVDGGSADGTREIAGQRAKVVTAERGRATQMNAGAKQARGDLLLFLHADCLPPRGFADSIRRALAYETVQIGAFRLRIEATGALFRLLERAANLRSAWFSTPYGDQGFFLRREVFDKLGGFPELPILEDYALARAARAQGTVVTLSVPMLTSARRWRKEGILRLTAKNVVTYFAYPLGLSPDRIARWYGRA